MLKKILLLCVYSCSFVIQATIDEAYWNLAQELHAAQKPVETLDMCTRLLALNPHHASCLLLAGTLYYNQGNVPRALDCFKQRHALMPDCSTTNVYLGMSYALTNNTEQAINHYLKALHHDPGLIKAYGTLAIAYEKTGNIPLALQAYKDGLTRSTDNLEYKTQYARLLKMSEQYTQALEEYNQLLEIHPANETFLYAKAEICILLKKYDEGLALYEKLYATKKTVQSLIAAAQAHLRAGSYEQASALYETLIAAKPDLVQVAFDIAKLQLCQGNTEKGFFYLHRSNHAYTRDKKFLPSLSDIPGSTIQIKGEWLHEDMLHFIRYARILKELGAFIIVQTPRALKDLLSRCPYIDSIVSLEDKEPCHIDWFIPITSLPYIFRDQNIAPAHTIPYIYSDPHLRTQWHEKLSCTSSKKIGIYLKKCSPPFLKELITALPATSHIFILHSGQGYGALHDLPENYTITLYGKGFDESAPNIATLAAIIDNLDLLITENCTVAHLAGSLGKQTMVLLEQDPLAWRWMTNELQTTWYPTVHTLSMHTADFLDQLSLLVRSKTS